MSYNPYRDLLPTNVVGNQGTYYQANKSFEGFTEGKVYQSPYTFDRAEKLKIREKDTRKIFVELINDFGTKVKLDVSYKSETKEYIDQVSTHEVIKNMIDFSLKTTRNWHYLLPCGLNSNEKESFYKMYNDKLEHYKHTECCYYNIKSKEDVYVNLNSADYTIFNNKQCFLDLARETLGWQLCPSLFSVCGVIEEEAQVVIYKIKDTRLLKDLWPQNNFDYLCMPLLLLFAGLSITYPNFNMNTLVDENLSVLSEISEMTGSKELMRFLITTYECSNEAQVRNRKNKLVRTIKEYAQNEQKEIRRIEENRIYREVMDAENRVFNPVFDTPASYCIRHGLDYVKLTNGHDQVLSISKGKLSYHSQFI